MWKRVLLATSLILLCVVAVILCNLYFDNSTNALVDKVDKCLDAAEIGDKDIILECADQLKQEYSSRRTLLSAMMNNRTLDAVDELVYKVDILSEDEKGLDVVKESLASLRYQFGRLLEDNRLNIKNIF